MPVDRVEIGPHVLYCGDCLKILPTLEAGSVDAVCCDPPYGLEFMGQDWDHGVPGVPFWQAIARVCLPGSPLLAFGGTRTSHRLVCAIEDAGWEIRDCVLWLYGSGFPKSLDISKAIDELAFTDWLGDHPIEADQYREQLKEAKGNPKATGHIRRKFRRAAGTLREVVGAKSKVKADNSASGGEGATYTKGNGYEGGYGISGDITAPATDAAKLWHGYGTALKPAYEPICVAMKPLDGTFAANAVKHGVAGLNVDGCRIGTSNDGAARSNTPGSGRMKRGGGLGGSRTFARSNPSQPLNENQGRWPANVIHDGSDEALAGFPESHSGHWPDTRGSGGLGCDGHGGQDGLDGRAANSGSAARFFYTAKASRSERNWGCGELEADNVNDGRSTSIDNPYQRGDTMRRNVHPTVKPLALMEYLIKLVTMPRPKLLLDPFMGSGTTGVACAKLGRKFIGIEIERKYFDIACKRVAAEVAQGKLFADT